GCVGPDSFGYAPWLSQILPWKRMTMTDRDLAARDRAEAGVARPEGRAAVPSEDGERVAQPSDYDPGSAPDRTRDGRATPVAGEPTALVAGEPTERVGGEPTERVGGEPTERVGGEPTAPVTEEPTATVIRPRTSGAAVVGALLAAVGLCGALTGLL